MVTDGYFEIDIEISYKNKTVALFVEHAELYYCSKAKALPSEFSKDLIAIVETPLPRLKLVQVVLCKPYQRKMISNFG